MYVALGGARFNVKYTKLKVIFLKGVNRSTADPKLHSKNIGAVHV